MSIEKFQEAYAEIQSTTDPYRYAYLKWIGYHMWKLFDYESGLEVINSEEKYKQWRKPGRSGLAEDAKRCIKRRDKMGGPVTFPLNPSLVVKDK